MSKLLNQKNNFFINTIIIIIILGTFHSGPSSSSRRTMSKFIDLFVCCVVQCPDTNKKLEKKTSCLKALGVNNIFN